MPAAAGGGSDAARRETAAERFLARETEYLGSELRRVLGVSAVCLGLLAALVVVDRLA